MSEPANISAAAASAQCPTCKKMLLTRSARLCLFCGEKLPEGLLLPLSEVQREEQQSLAAVKRVISAYEQREAEMVERARYTTPSGVLFSKKFEGVDQQLGEMFFPEVGADEWALHEFNRTLKLPDDDFDARRHKKQLDDRIRKLASKLAGSFGRLGCKIGADQAGHLSLKLTDKALSVAIDAQFGRNATFLGGVSQSFRSYSIRAEGRVLALNKSEASARWIRIACMTAGLLTIPVGLVWLGYTIARAAGLEMVHQLWLSETGIALALLIGSWIGGKAGHALAAMIERRTFNRAEADGALPRMESLWTALTEGIEDVTREYEIV